jgi:hypothetical protein
VTCCSLSVLHKEQNTKREREREIGKKSTINDIHKEPKSVGSCLSCPINHDRGTCACRWIFEGAKCSREEEVKKRVCGGGYWDAGDDECEYCMQEEMKKAMKRRTKEEEGEAMPRIAT